MMFDKTEYVDPADSKPYCDRYRTHRHAHEEELVRRTKECDELKAERDRLARELEEARAAIASAQQTIEMHMCARKHYETELARMRPVVEAVTVWRLCTTPETIGRVLDTLKTYLADAGKEQTDDHA